MKRIHRRKGQELEYVEFRKDKNSVSVCAQRAGNFWNVFELQPGKNGAVRVLHTNIATMDDAEAIAHKEARKLGL